MAQPRPVMPTNQTFECGSNDDYSRSMRDPAVRQRRRAMLHAPHMRSLTAYVTNLRGCGLGQVPEFDPFDGGINARVLFLFEKPGPMTADGKGSGFISRNNDDPSAEATFNFMQDARIPRKLTVTWNLIPWWNGTRRTTGQEVRNGTGWLEELIRLLPNLCVIMLVGKQAGKAERYLKKSHPTLRVFSSAHPSPLVRAKFPDRWKSIPLQWAELRGALGLEE